MADTVSLTIDDKQISVPGGTLVVEAARSAGIQIPVFCSHPKLDPVGVCRMCMVEYVTPRGSRVDISCTVPVTEGMVVRTNTPAVKAAREAVLGFLLINHPLDCPICDKGGECPLQDQTLQYGPGASKFVEEKNHKAKHYPLSELVILDQERCVLCWRCVRYMEEWEDKPQLGLHKRGDSTFIDVFPGQPLDGKTSGSVIDICPVGALTDRTARFDYRPWELKKTASICTLCPVGCNLRLDERSHELRRIVARENPAVNEDWICDKGRFVRDYVDHPERLKTPLVRENGALRPATWDEALQCVVERLGAVIEAHGAKSAGAVAGAHLSNEAAFLCQKFFRVLLGNNNVDFPTGAAVRATPTGLPAIDALKQSDLIVLVGLDLSESAPVLDLMIKRAVKRNKAKLLILNPRRIEAARYPGAYLPVRPGSEAIALNGLAAWLLAKRAANARQSGSAKPAAQTFGPGGPNGQAEWAWLQQLFTPEQVEAGSGVTAATLAAAAELLASSQRALFLYGPDAGAGQRGAATVSALNNLAGLLGRAECVAYIPSEANSQGARDMGFLPNALPGHSSVADASLRERLGKLWGVQPPAEPGFIYDQMINGAVRALFVIGANPALDPAAAQALRQLDFLVVQDLFLTETAQLAEVVLPSASFAEADGTYTNLERRVQRAPKGIRALGESRADWEILAALGQYWQTARGTQAEGSETVAQAEWKRRRRAKPAREGRQAAARQAAAAKPWSYSNLAAVSEEIGRVVPFYAGFHWEALGSGGLQWAAGAAPRSAARLGSARVEPAQVAPVPAAPAGSFWLASGPILWDGGTITAHSHPQVLKLIPAPFVALNPADLASSKLSEGSEVSVTSPRGSVRLLLRADPSVQPGTAWLPLGLAGAPAEILGAGKGEPVAVKIG
jgi:NADH-quinone oxidoreductase subunit G